MFMNPTPLMYIFLSFSFFTFFNALLFQLLFRINNNLGVSILIFFIHRNLLQSLFDHILPQANEPRLIIFDEHSVTVINVWYGHKKFYMINSCIVHMGKYCFVWIIVLYVLHDIAYISDQCMCNNFAIVYMFFRLKTINT